MARQTLRVEGLRELDKAWRAADKELAKEMRARLREVGEIVAREARARLAPLSEASASSIVPRARANGAFAEQKRRRTTGKRPDWGSRQMSRAFVPALEAKQDEVVEAYEQKVLAEVERKWARE